MPVSVNYPGVYIEEIPSGVRTIASVATSITAFVGKAVRGPTGNPVTITSFADFERLFGGLHRDFTLGYAVRDFFLNGGATAIVVRLYKPTANKGSKASFNITNLTVEAANEGAWGMKVRVRIEKKASTDPEPPRRGCPPRRRTRGPVRCHRPRRQHRTHRNLPERDDEGQSPARRPRAEERIDVDPCRPQALPAATPPGAHSGALTEADVWTDQAKSTPAQSTADDGSGGQRGDRRGRIQDRRQFARENRPVQPAMHPPRRARR